MAESPANNTPARRFFRSPSSEATEAFGEALGRLLEPGQVLALSGEMGAGKTTLVRGLARGLGVDPDDVSSPTFALMHEYEGRVPVTHFDAWMAGRETVFLEGGAAEFIGGDSVALIEWADRVRTWLPEQHLWLTIIMESLESRALTLTSPGGGAREAAALAALQTPEEIEER